MDTNSSNPVTSDDSRLARKARVLEVAEYTSTDPRDIFSQLVWEGREGGWTLEEVEALLK